MIREPGNLLPSQTVPPGGTDRRQEISCDAFFCVPMCLSSLHMYADHWSGPR